MDWNCTLTEDRLSDFLDGQLSPGETAALSRHAAGCARCTKLVARVGRLVKRMQQLEQVEEPPFLAAKILDATLGPRVSKRGWQRWLSWPSMLWQPRFAMGVGTVAATLFLVFQTAGVTPAKLKKADLNPANMLRAADRQAHLTYARGLKFVNDLRVVYEIQSRLQPEPVPTAAPTPKSSPDKQAQPPSANPRHKTETDDHPGRSQVRSGTMMAFALNNIFLRSPR